MSKGFEGGPDQAPPAEQDPKAKAFGHIEMVRQQCAVMGFNDTEWGQLDEIKRQLEEDEISPEEAQMKADGVFNSKQDYH